MSNVVYIATSLDGYIADQQGGLDWLHSLPNPEGNDFGFAAFVDSVDALVMGRTTFETVLSFGIDWPYSKPVFVLSSTLREVPSELEGKVEIVNGPVKERLAELNARGFRRLYIDGGRTIQSLMAEDLIDELILTRIPVVLGGGVPLFGALPKAQWYEHVTTQVHIDQMVMSHYRRRREAQS
ncbi:dihydrofolate reductase family protein [Ferrimonas marina]|uniref:Dihydrofolate reductase n=1 Tax=Ferrimonas marina TaxID=299255 RepID=A0A1M5XS17_9GAMM|nr:dihydrofolate reductase family protein [Ferrimonas marina]SHI02617.1 Dihydrofolate reductase [Ferrimonas marina]